MYEIEFFGFWPQDLDIICTATEQAEPPPELRLPLLPYQKQFLAWALKQEQSVVRGGILADEMGELITASK